MNVALFPPSSGKEENDCPLYLVSFLRLYIRSGEKIKS